MEQPQTSGQAIRHVRLIIDLTQKAFAKRVGLSLPFVKLLEYDERGLTHDVACRISRKTGVGVESLKHPKLWGGVFNRDGWIYGPRSYGQHLQELGKIDVSDGKKVAKDFWKKYESYFVDAEKEGVLADFHMRIADEAESAYAKLDLGILARLRKEPSNPATKITGSEKDSTT